MSSSRTQPRVQIPPEPLDLQELPKSEEVLLTPPEKLQRKRGTSKYQDDNFGKMRKSSSTFKR